MSNLRIKNKRLKRELEMYKKRTTKPMFVYERSNVDVIMASRIFPQEDLPFVNEKVVRNLLIEDLREEIGEHMEITSQPSDYIPGGVRYNGKLRLIGKSKED